MKENVEVKKLLNACGALAELSLTFYRATLGAGATETEAFALTLAFMNTIVNKGGAEKQEDNA